MDGSGKTDGTNSTYQWVGEINAASSVDELAGFCSCSVKTVQIVSSLEPRIWWEVRSSPSSTIINLCLCFFFFGGGRGGSVELLYVFAAIWYFQSYEAS